MATPETRINGIRYRILMHITVLRNVCADDLHVSRYLYYVTDNEPYEVFLQCAQ